MNKTAIIIGSTGQDGAYLSKFLLNKGYKVISTRRRTSMLNTQRIDYILRDQDKKNFIFEYLDLSDAASISRIIHTYMPDEIYNLAAQSHVAVSFEQPEYTADVNALGVLRILEAIRMVSNDKKIKFYQASTSELFGDVLSWPQNEQTPFNPVSPYAVSKEFAHKMVSIYRKAYGIHACCGILFNHESPLRGMNFVTKKIVRGVNDFINGQTTLELGNLDAVRDWGHAEDYVEMQWLMLNTEVPEDFVIATGNSMTVREFVNKVCKKYSISIEWRGSGLEEAAYIIGSSVESHVGKKIVCVNEKYFRPLEVSKLEGDSSRAKEKLGWKPRKSIDDLISEMIEFENLKGSFDAI